MKTAAVICEYNPFHNGHRYQLEYMKGTLSADHNVCIMSGNFVQRGEPAIVDKYKRAEIALKNGADLVLEIPPVFAVSSAREFAAAGVGIAVKSGIIDTLCFGSEGHVSEAMLREYAKLIYKNPDSAASLDKHGLCSVASHGTNSDDEHHALHTYGSDFKCHDNGPLRNETFDALIKKGLKSGMTYPAAVSAAADTIYDKQTAAELLLPNNILGAAYLHALSVPEIFFPHSVAFGSAAGTDAQYDDIEIMKRIISHAASIEPAIIRRRGSGYNDTDLSDDFSSASAIRELLRVLYTDTQLLPSPDAGSMHNTLANAGSSTAGAAESNAAGLNAGKELSAQIFERLSGSVPHDMLSALKAAYEAHTLSFSSDLSISLSMRLLDAAASHSSLTAYLDVSREISDRLLNTADRIMSFDARVMHTKTRQYTYSRISRALLHIILCITAGEAELRKRNGYIDYIRILGFRSDAAENGLLKRLKQNSLVPVIAKAADHKELLSRDIYCDQFYWALKNQKGEFERSPVIVKDH